MLGPIALLGFAVAQLDLQGPEKVCLGSWVCKNVGRTREMPFRLNCRNFGVNEINELG